MRNAAVSSNHAGLTPVATPDSLERRIRHAILWRSGGAVAGQVVQWAATFLVIRILDPRDYGLFAMTGVVVAFLNMANGHGLASGVIQREAIGPREIRQLFGILIALNLVLAATQLALAPVAAAYYREPVVAPLLRVQALLYLTTPFIVLPYALLGRAMDFRSQANATLAAAIASAAAALGGALLGLGVWTLVIAPLVLFAVRAAVMTRAARSLMWPSFDPRGMGRIVRYGGLVAAAEMFWILQSQADVVIAGRHFSAHLLGLYTTALFLAQLFVAKVVPPLNEVAFSAYARLPRGGDALGNGFVRAAGAVMAAAMPCYLGLAATAEPLVATALGERWLAMAPVARVLALAMPFMTLQVLIAPACDARGRPGVAVGNGAVGSAILIAAFAIGVHWGPIGIAWSWLAGYPLYLAISLRRSLPVIGARFESLAAAVMPPVLAAIGMALVVTIADRALPPLTTGPRLATLVAIGAAVYAGWLALFAREAMNALVAMIRGPVQAERI